MNLEIIDRPAIKGIFGLKIQSMHTDMENVVLLPRSDQGIHQCFTSYVCGQELKSVTHVLWLLYPLFTFYATFVLFYIMYFIFYSNNLQSAEFYAILDHLFHVCCL